jgi:acyl dehydratase
MEQGSKQGRSVEIGQTFARSFHFGEQEISEFARSAGDTNPLHHDRKIAELSRFGSIIASGTHCSALMMGLVADRFAREGEAVGLEFSFPFKRAVPAGSTMTAGMVGGRGDLERKARRGCGPSGRDAQPS